MKNKKGAGTVIAWVLLLGFSVGLATTVFLWTTQQTEEMSESATNFVEGGMQCDNVMINVAVEDPAACTITVTNTRYLNIYQLSIRKLYISDPLSYIYDNKVIEPRSESKLPAKYTASIYLSAQGNYCGKIEVMPIIKVDDELVGCKNKAVTIDCNPC